VLKSVDKEESSAKLRSLVNKDKLSALEMMQEAAFTEILNKESLERLQKLEDENKNQW